MSSPIERPRSAIWRIAHIDARLRRGVARVTAPVLAEDLEVSTRTVYRDLEYLRDTLGAPLEFDPIDNTYRYTQATWRLPAVSWTEGELIALFLAERLLRDYTGTPYEADIRRAFGKIVATLPERVSIRVDDLASTLSARTTSVTPHDVETFQALAQATRDRQRVELEYEAATDGGVTNRRVDPYHLANINGGWYLLAYCHLREDLRMFRPARIRRARVTAERVERPDDVSLQQHLDGAFAVHRGDGELRRVVLDFDAVAARFIRERTWHDSQRLTPRDDGGVRMELELQSLVEVRKLALSWGDRCRVVAPPELVDELRAITARMAASYASDGERTP